MFLVPLFNLLDHFFGQCIATDFRRGANGLHGQNTDGHVVFVTFVVDFGDPPRWIILVPFWCGCGGPSGLGERGQGGQLKEDDEK